jgi:hypothetical protein
MRFYISFFHRTTSGPNRHAQDSFFKFCRVPVFMELVIFTINCLVYSSPESQIEFIRLGMLGNMNLNSIGRLNNTRQFSLSNDYPCKGGYGVADPDPFLYGSGSCISFGYGSGSCFEFDTDPDPTV